MSSWRRRTKIVCTIGPATTSRSALRGLRQAGMNVARLNFSHGSLEEHAERIRLLRELSEEIGRPIAILQDLAGPKFRIGDLRQPLVLKRGQRLTLTPNPPPDDPAAVPVDLPQMVAAVRPGSRIYLDDGLLELKVVSKVGSDVLTRVVTGGELNSRKGLVLPDTHLDLPSLTDKDRRDLSFGIEQGVDWVAVSFLRTPHDVLEVKDFIRSQGSDIPVMAKIETGEAVDNIDAIIAVSDAVMVARGDLGVELPVCRVPAIQKRIIERCNRLGKPVVTATQMLDSMIRNPRPTRAEVTDVANAVIDGTDCVMLSGETAVGKYPLEAVRMMSRVVLQAEATLDYDSIRRRRVSERALTVADAISQAAAEMAHDLKAKAVIASTCSGYTARMVSRYRPRVPIIGVTSQERTYRRLQLVWGVRPWLMPHARDTDETLRHAVEVARMTGVVKQGDTVVVTAGVPSGVAGHTNLIKVETI